MHAWQNIRPFWSITCWVVVMILGHANTNMACFVGIQDDQFLLHG